MATTITIPLGEPLPSSTKSYFTRLGPITQTTRESNLLSSIRSALRGTSSETVVLDPGLHSTSFISLEEVHGEEELIWNDHTVVLSVGGVMKRKWNFQAEGQPVQWACMAFLEQSVSSSKRKYSNLQRSEQKSPSPKPPAERPTFGPFSQTRQETTPVVTAEGITPAVVVFLRSIGKVFVRNGFEYTFSLPFIVRRAWPVTPHGIILQRALDPGEVEEAELTGDSVLPTIFGITSPFAEAGAVGLTTGIIGGNARTPLVRLKDEAENASRPLKSVPSSEVLIWASHKGPSTSYELVVTVDAEKRGLSIWRYVYIKPKDTPTSLSRTRRRRHTASFSKKPSMIFADPSSSDVSQNSPTQDLPAEPVDLPPLASLPGMPPSLSTTTTMASLTSGEGPSRNAQGPQSQPQQRVRRNSLTRNELSTAVDRMVLGNRMETDASLAPMEHGRMKSAFWMEKLYSFEIADTEARLSRDVSVSLFDHRYDGKTDRCLLAICLPSTQKIHILSVASLEDGRLHIEPQSFIPGISAAPVRALRTNVWDLLVVRPDGSTSFLTHGLHELPVNFAHDVILDESTMMVDQMLLHPIEPERFQAVRAGYFSSITLTCPDGSEKRANTNLIPKDVLTTQALHVLALSLPPELFYSLHIRFLANWASHHFQFGADVEFRCFTSAFYQVFELDVDEEVLSAATNPWSRLGRTDSHRRFREDAVIQKLSLPPTPPLLKPSFLKRHPYLSPTLYALHTLGEDLRLNLHRHQALLRLAPLICRVASIVRPEWADHWIRLCPETCSVWQSVSASVTSDNPDVDERISALALDVSAILFGRITGPEWKLPFYDVLQMAVRSEDSISFAFGRVDPHPTMTTIIGVYRRLADGKTSSSQGRAENAVYFMVGSEFDMPMISKLPVGLAAPLREAARACQLAPPADWPFQAYQFIGRDDVAISAYHAPDPLFKDGYRPVKEFISPTTSPLSINEIASHARTLSAGDLDTVTGVELELDDFTHIRFGQDRRLDEVARMLCSSQIPSIKVLDRPDLSEHDQAKEQQHQVVRIAERTLALPYGRAMFTYGSVPTVTREAYVIPKLEYSIRLQPTNITVNPEPGKLLPESCGWGEFHNGVAAGLRISPFTGNVESSWIAFNKPSELTPGHAGFLFGLGLTGHLKELMSWHTFAYLTPKHDLTSIGVLLGLAAANIGNGDRHVTKLLAVHTPALLPTPTVDLNVSLMTQAAGLSGVGLLYLGTKNRRMAEVCLYQISRRDLVQPDLSNEYREAYTYSAALAFGMIMLGKGSAIPADVSFLSRLTTLTHGDTNALLTGGRPSFDVNLTSPAASIALGLMYLRTERQDIADILSIPDTVLALNRVQPMFLLIRTLARSLIMWDSVAPTAEWLAAQIPNSIKVAIETRFKNATLVDDALELAYYNIIAGCCFAVGLKYAGTARQDAYKMIIRYYDLYTRLVYTNGPTFDNRIKRSAIRDGLNLISISLCMVMAGTGEITCFRRLRYAYGMYMQTMYHPGFKYGIHVATHVSMGLLFLGGGRFTLGTSDAAIACMVTAFFPRFHALSSDNKCYLQALRHLWVLAAEPRCLIARDVETREVVYLPLKITLKDEVTQLVSPTLIPDLDKILSIRVDTPRYWPFHLDLQQQPQHKTNLLQSQTLYVKRKTAFLSYTEDPRGSRSLFVRSRSSAGEPATLDFPQVTDTKTHPAGDLSEFITSFSNDPLYLAFADHFSLESGETYEERLFETYCHATLFDSILQGKPQSIQSHLSLYQYRTMSLKSQYFHLRLQDLRFAAEFYGKVYDRRFSGRTENNYRVPLIRDSTAAGALHALDQQLDTIRIQPSFLAALGHYVNCEPSRSEISQETAYQLSWYLLRNAVPVSTMLVILRDLARDAHAQCLGVPAPGGTDNVNLLEESIKQVLHSAGSKITTTLGAQWGARSLDEVLAIWTNRTGS